MDFDEGEIFLPLSLALEEGEKERADVYRRACMCVGPGKDGGNGPYYQSQRKHIYDKHLEPLLSVRALLTLPQLHTSQLIGSFECVEGKSLSLFLYS